MQVYEVAVLFALIVQSINTAVMLIFAFVVDVEAAVCLCAPLLLGHPWRLLHSTIHANITCVEPYLDGVYEVETTAGYRNA